MNLRIVLLASSLAAVPAWSQETPTFDLGSFSLSELTKVCPGRQSTWGLTEPVGYVPRELRPR